MFGVTELFSGVDGKACIDVATALVAAGITPGMKIPIYEAFDLEILNSSASRRFVTSVPEYNALVRLTKYCGAVPGVVNVTNAVSLPLIGLVAVITPHTGVSLLAKTMIGDYPNMADEIVPQDIAFLCDALGVQFNAGDAMNQAIAVAQHFCDELISMVAEETASVGIKLYGWENIWNLHNAIRDSGDMREMGMYRYNNRCPQF